MESNFEHVKPTNYEPVVITIKHDKLRVREFTFNFQKSLNAEEES
jgi:hypothetical protein